MLRVDHLSQNYGGVSVLSNVSFSIESGERVGLIGPNGAGKTTMINVLTGLLPAASGGIYFLGQNVTDMPAYKRVALGMARSFQKNTLFPDLSLLDNVRLAVQGTKSSRYQMFRLINSYRNILKEAEALLKQATLWEKRYAVTGTLSHGEQRQLEILLALASKPKLLYMDEPSAGLTSAQTAGLINRIRNLLGDTTVFFCAHDMELVFSLADRVMVLYYGEIIAHGTPEEIRANSKVREIYLGPENEDTGIDRGAHLL
jgi:branched-chain amino acid transport system ATP-binding protein